MQPHTDGADGRIEPGPTRHPAPLSKWITINDQASIPHNPLFSKKA